MQDAQIAQKLKTRFGDKVLAVNAENVKEASVDLASTAVHEVCAFCRSDPELDLDLLVLVTGTDYPQTDEIQVVYHVESVDKLHKIALRTRLPRSDPRVATVSDVWPAADWHERETYDLLGVIFEGHPNLTRILLPEDWVGFPLRKDYEFPKEYHGIPCSKEYAQARGFELPMFTDPESYR
jgi:NADH-quinone oxidoreductase subunit C